MQHRDAPLVSFYRRLFADCFKQVPIRALLTAPSLIPFLVLVALTGWLLWWHGQRTVARLAFQVQTEVGDRVQFELETYLAAPRLITQINRDAVRLKQLDLTHSVSVEQHLFTQLAQFKAVSGILIGTEQGSLHSVDRRNGLPLLTLDLTNREQIQSNALNTADQKLRLNIRQNGSDLRHSVWYQAASRARKPIWSPIFPTADQQDLTLNANQPIIDSAGRVVGVVSAGVLLSEIGQFLNKIQVSASGVVFIVERDGHLIGSSTDQLPYQTQQKQGVTQLQQIPATASQHALIRETTRQILTQVGQFSNLTAEQQLTFRQNGSRKFVRVVPHRDPLGLDWLIVIVVPELDFMTPMGSDTRMAFLLCLAAVVTPWMMGGIVASWTQLRQRFSALSQAAVSQAGINQARISQAMAEADLDGEKPQAHALQAMGITTQTFNQVAEKLNLSFKQIETENTNLEAQVRERTAQLCQALEFEDLLRRTIEKVRDSLDEAHILQTVVRELTLGLGVQGCDVSLYNLEDGTSTLYYEHLGDHLSSAQGRSVTFDTLPVYQLLLQRQHTQFCLLEPFPTALRCEQAQFACLSCPMMDDQGVMGDLWLFKSKQQSFSLQEIRLVQQIANQCAIALRQSQLYQTAQSQVKELEQLHRIKDDFLSTVSHELRTPMANIKMGTQLLEMSLEHSGFLEVTTAPVYRYLQILKDEAHREMTLINDLLDLSRLDAGVEPCVVTTIDPQIWIPHVVEPFIERTQMQRQRLQLDLPPELPPLTTDLADLERILSELLNNACKYTPAGERIVVMARVLPVPDERDEQGRNKGQPQSLTALANRHLLGAKGCPLEPIFARDLLGQPAPPQPAHSPTADARLYFLLKVTNSGVEIPKSEQSRIFEKFYRIPSDDPWKCGGTGLGLALVKGLVERLSGQIWVESHAETTTFTVRLPLEVL